MRTKLTTDSIVVANHLLDLFGGKAGSLFIGVYSFIVTSSLSSLFLLSSLPASNDGCKSAGQIDDSNNISWDERRIAPQIVG